MRRQKNGHGHTHTWAHCNRMPGAASNIALVVRASGCCEFRIGRASQISSVRRMQMNIAPMNNESIKQTHYYGAARR